VDSGESALEAFFREVLEEVGLPADSYDIEKQIEGYRYDFPPSKQSKKGYIGQEQTYFLCRLHDDAPKIDIFSHSDEFQNYKWIKTKNFKRKWLPTWKHRVYEAVMWDFFAKKLKD
jgi:8-oxo-dGTP pyrophosphatase MutT (NUDIX family)